MSDETNLPDEGAELDAAFMDATAHVPGEVKDDHTADFRDVNQTAAGPQLVTGAAVPGWTVEGVAAVFSGIFTLLVTAKIFIPIGGEHWNIPEEKTMKLGYAFLPIFQKHIPYGSGEENWLPTLIMWVGAIGALNAVCGDAIKVEIRNYKLERVKATLKARGMGVVSQTANTEMGTSPASYSSPESAAAAKQQNSGASLQ